MWLRNRFGGLRGWFLLLALVSSWIPARAAADDGRRDKGERQKGEGHDKDGRTDDGRACVRVIGNLDEGAKVLRKGGFLGVHIVYLTPELRRFYTRDEKTGVLVGGVVPDSPAAKAGLAVGDVLVAVDGNKVRSSMQVGRIIRNKKKGDKIKLRVLRSGKTKNLVAELDERQRTVADLSGFVHWPGDDDSFEFHFDPEAFQVQIDPDEIEKLVRQGLKPLRAPEWKKNLKRLKKLYKDERGLEDKLKKIEKRLDELERKLQSRGRSSKAAHLTT